LIRRASSFNTRRIEHLYNDPHLGSARLRLHYSDLTDPNSLRRVLDEVQPHEVYNLGAQSHVRVSFDVEIDARYFRPAEVDFLQGDAGRAREKLGWTPEVSFDQLVDLMVEADLKLAAREKMLRDAGHVDPGDEPHDP
jgi:GDP-D-mannose dehydratase